MKYLVISLAWAWSAQASFFPPSTAILKTSQYATDPERALRVEQSIERFHQKLAPLALAKEAELVVVPIWQDPRINALALKKPGIMEIQIYGGLMNHPELDEDELTLVLCHELGHHLGGVPLASRQGWSSCEGQADFWSATVCATLLRDPEAAALKLTRLYANNSSGPWPQLNGEDPLRVERTYYGYPSAQCRLDTLLRGFKGMPRPNCWYAPE